MDRFLLTGLLAVCLVTVAMAEVCSSSNCSGQGKKCVKNQCLCKEFFFTSESTGQCLKSCSNPLDQYVSYEKNMIEQGQSYEMTPLDGADADDSTCQQQCIDNPDCVGVSVKRNENTGRGKCFFYNSDSGILKDHFKDTKGRWTYHARMCQ